MRQPAIVALALLVAACSESAPPPQPPPPQADAQAVATNTGAIAVVAVGETLKAYIPGGSGADGHYRIWVVNAAEPSSGASGNLGAVDIGVDGDAEAVAAIDGLVVAVSFGTPYLWFIDPSTDQVTTQLKLPDSYGSWDVSDRNAFMSAVALDPVRRRGYVTVFSGFKVLDLDAQAFLGDILVAPSENFALDPVANRLLAPFYLCPPPGTGSGPSAPCDSYRSPDGTQIVQGFNVVELDTGDVFTYVDPAAPDQSSPLGIEPDAASVDPGSQQVLVAPESPSEIHLLDLAAATFDRTTATFTAPLITLTSLPGVTGLAVEPGSGLAIGSQERGPNLSFIDLATTTASGPARNGILPDLPWGAGPWGGHADPHGVLGGVVNGKPVAWIVNQPHTWMARLDLELLQQGANATTGDLDPALVAQAVTYVFVPPAP